MPIGSFYDKIIEDFGWSSYIDNEHRVIMEVKVMNIIEQINQENVKTEVPKFNVGDTVKVSFKVIEGTRERIQVYEGTIIAKKHAGIAQTVTVRRLSYGVGVEKIFPVNSPNIDKIEIVRKGKVRRAKLYYLRDRVGKSAKVKERKN